MNIGGVNLLSLSPGNNTVEGVAGTKPLSENNTIPENFSNALMGQIALIEVTGQVELPRQLQSMAMPQTIGNLHDSSNLLKHADGKEERAALLDKYLPLSYKKNETTDLNKDAGLEATLLALTNTLPSITPDQATTPPSPLPLTDTLTATMPGGTPYQATTTPPSPLPLTDTLIAMMPGSTPYQATTQGIGGIMALPFVKPLPEEAKLNIPVEDMTSGDFLQKETVIYRSILDEQGFNLQSLENLEPVKKTLITENQTSLIGVEKAVSGVTAEISPLHRLIDNRTDILTITKPLTHPGWSKDLGEQIVWMNNKAIPAAEIRLNPAHLGPISVRIDVNQDQTTIMFTALHAEVKEAIEASLPKLREMLATQQLNLVNVNISQNSTSNQSRSQSQDFSKTPENHEQGIGGIPTIEKAEDQIVVKKGLLSLYA